MSEARSVRQSAEKARHHTHLVGPTGTGKTSLLVSLALDDLAHGVGIAPWVDPKDGKGADALLARIPKDYADRVVLFDPLRQDYAVGLNIMQCDSPEDRDIVVDQIVAVFEQLFKDVWGKRQAELLYMALTTLLYHKGTTLCDLPRLFQDPGLRKRAQRGIKDPDLLAFWERYEKMPTGDVAPLLSRLSALLLRPRVRNILGQRESTVDFKDILDNGGIVIARLPLKLADTSTLLGSFLFLRIWQVIQNRESQDEAKLKDAGATLDEGQLFMRIRGSVASVFDLGRSAKWGITFANQRLGQLPDEMLDALEVNALTKVVFRPTTLDNAKDVAALLPGVPADALLKMETRQVAVKFPDSPPFVGRTPDLPEPIRDPRTLADHALKKYGRPREVVEKEVAEGLNGKAWSDNLSDFDRYA